MLHKEKNVSVIGTIILLLVILNVLILKIAFIQNESWYWALVITLPLLLIAVLYVRQTKHGILHNYPVIVRLNSRVVVKEDNKDTLIDLILVVPEKADKKERRISVFAPIGTALIGFREGAEVKWDVPSGSTTFKVIKVYNSKK